MFAVAVKNVVSKVLATAMSKFNNIFTWIKLLK